MTQPPPHTTRRHFHGLDTLRGIAALLVALYHLSGMKYGFAGYVLVDFFLVLSGFVLAHSYLYRSVAVGKWEFAIRRFARLWPMHVVALFLMYGAVYYPLYGRFFSEPGSNSHNTWNTLIQNLTLTHNIGLPPNGPYVWSWNTPSWSISVEFWVNILFILLITKRTKNLSMLVLSVVCLGVVFHGAGSLGSYNENFFAVLNSGMLRGIASFVLGIISYRLYLRYKDRAMGAGLASLLELLCAALVVFFLYTKHLGMPGLELLAPFAFTLMVPFLACEHGHLSKAAVHFKYLGTISYSVYLNHMGIWILFSHKWIADHVGDNGRLAIQMVVLLIFSHFTFQYIERPSQRFLLKRLLPKRP
ncbi:MAG: acyltransferase [Planctomycetota bacterium]|nr:acyltransferase [Planctomycetota bacterium]